jgi:hypothetical protein
VSSLALDPREQEELYVVLKPREGELPPVLTGLVRRIEKELFQRLTIEEMERLSARFKSHR